MLSLDRIQSKCETIFNFRLIKLLVDEGDVASGEGSVPEKLVGCTATKEDSFFCETN